MKARMGGAPRRADERGGRAGVKLVARECDRRRTRTVCARSSIAPSRSIKSGVVVLAAPATARCTSSSASRRTDEEGPGGQLVKQLAPIVGGGAAAGPISQKPAAKDRVECLVGVAHPAARLRR
jgi:hypothetical protein